MYGQATAHVITGCGIVLGGEVTLELFIITPFNASLAGHIPEMETVTYLFVVQFVETVVFVKVLTTVTVHLHLLDLAVQL